MSQGKFTGLRLILISVVCLAALAFPALTEERPALENPSLAVGLNGITDWSTQHPFIDLMKTARPFVGHLRGQYGGFEPDQLRAEGYLDENGWPRAVPPGVEALESLVLTDQPVAAQGLAGRYVLTYEGIARVQVTGAVSRVRYSPDAIHFDFTPGQGPVAPAGGRASPIGAGFEAVFGRPLVFTFEGLVLASLLVNLPFAVQPIHNALAAIPPNVRDAARCCGLSPAATLRRIELPLALPGIATAAVLTFAHTLGEFGVVLMVGGSIPGETRTVAIAIYDRVQAFDDAGAGSMALALLVLAVLALWTTNALARRAARRD